MVNNGVDFSSYPYHLIRVKVGYSSNEVEMCYAKSGHRDISSPWSIFMYDFKQVTLTTYNNGSAPSYRFSSDKSVGVGFNYEFYNYVSCNVPFSGNAKPIIWTTPELQESFDNNKQLSLQPAFDPLASYDIPTQQALQGLMDSYIP